MDFMTSNVSLAVRERERIGGDEGLRTRMESLTPLRRIGSVDDIAAAALWLCSPAGSYVTGKVIEVDGGIEAPNLPLGLADL